MKKLILLFAALLVAGCGEKSSSEGSESVSEKPRRPMKARSLLPIPRNHPPQRHLSQSHPSQPQPSSATAFQSPWRPSSTELQAAERGIPYFLLRENARPSVARPRSSGADGSGIWVT